MCIQVFFIKCKCNVWFHCLAVRCKNDRYISENTYCSKCFKVSLTRPNVIGILGLDTLYPELILDGLII